MSFRTQGPFPSCTRSETRTPSDQSIILTDSVYKGPSPGTFSVVVCRKRAFQALSALYQTSAFDISKHTIMWAVLMLCEVTSLSPFWLSESRQRARRRRRRFVLYGCHRAINQDKLQVLAQDGPGASATTGSLMDV